MSTGQQTPQITKLRRLLFEQQRTNRSLARETGIHPTTISRYASGLAIRPEHRTLIAQALGVTEEEL